MVGCFCCGKDVSGFGWVVFKRDRCLWVDENGVSVLDLSSDCGSISCLDFEMFGGICIDYFEVLINIMYYDDGWLFGC